MMASLCIAAPGSPWRWITLLRKGKRTVPDIIRAREAYVVTGKCCAFPEGKRVMPNPELVRQFQGWAGCARMKAFLAECDSDRSLRLAAEEQNLPLDEWRQELEDIWRRMG